MELITSTVVKKVWREINSLPDDKISDLVREMGEEQPELVDYILSLQNDPFTDEEHEILFFMSTSLWMMAHEVTGGKLQELTEEEIEKQQRHNFQMTDFLADEVEADLEQTFDMIIQGYGQPEALLFVLFIIHEDPTIAPILEISTSSGLMGLYLKIVLDCLDVAGNEH